MKQRQQWLQGTGQSRLCTLHIAGHLTSPSAWECKLLYELNISAPKLVIILGRLTESKGVSVTHIVEHRHILFSLFAIEMNTIPIVIVIIVIITVTFSSSCLKQQDACLVTLRHTNTPSSLRSVLNKLLTYLLQEPSSHHRYQQILPMSWCEMWFISNREPPFSWRWPRQLKSRYIYIDR